MFSPSRPERVAIVHEWLVNHAGSEKVVEQLLQIYPQADLYAVVDFLGPGERGFLGGRVARTTFIQRLPGARKRFRHYLPLMPLAVEQHDLSGYDLIVSSSHAVAKGVLTGPDQLHVCYIHSPIRYAWDMQHQYLRESGMDSGLKGAFARAMLHYMRLWDSRTAAGVDRFVANSAFIGRRVRKVYRREAGVVHPPVDVARFALRADKEDFYLTASRMVPYKRMPMIVEAFARMPQRRLVVIGDGPDMDKVRAAAGPNVTVLGFQDDATLVDHMQRARAFVFAAEEDFGITPVEAQACGTPVIAYGRGGSLETVRGRGDPAQRTGVFFDAQTPEALIAAVEAFEALPAPMAPETCRRHAEDFAPERFRERFAAEVERAWAAFHGEPESVPACLASPPPPIPTAAALPMPVPPVAEPVAPSAVSCAAAEPDIVPAVLAAWQPRPDPMALPPQPAPTTAAVSAHPARPIGELLRTLRPLSDGDIAHILVVQRRMGLRFGEAAVALDLASQADVLRALSMQFNYPCALDLSRFGAGGLVVATDPHGAQAEAFRELRSRILAGPRVPLAVLSPDRGDGRTHVAANLAITFSQLGERTVLVDGNLRAPALHRVFGLKERASLADLLNGRRPQRPFDRSAELPGLFVMQVGAPPPNPLELLQQPLFAVLLRELQREFDRVIVDTPPARDSADARVIAATCGQAVLVGRSGRTDARAMNLLVERLRRTRADIAGVVLNAY
jgi:chain length determinant protein tyrosine kinase EpsG